MASYGVMVDLLSSSDPLSRDGISQYECYQILKHVTFGGRVALGFPRSSAALQIEICMNIRSIFLDVCIAAPSQNLNPPEFQKKPTARLNAFFGLCLLQP